MHRDVSQTRMRMYRIRPVFVLLGLLLFSWLSPPARAREAGEMMLLRVKPAVVFIYSSIRGVVQINTKSGPKVFKDVGLGSSGSGFIINPNGYICTNGHVVQFYYEKNDKQLERLFLMQVIQKHFIPRLIKSGKIKSDPTSIKNAIQQLYGLLKPKSVVEIKKTLMVFLSNKKGYPAEVKDYSPPMGPYPGKIDVPGFAYESETGKDIAIIKIEAKDLPTAKLGDSSTVELGQSVYAAGYPGVVLTHALLQKSMANMLDCTVTVGHISGKKLTATGASLIQTDTPIAHGNSGGPAFNAKGEVIGMSTLASMEKTPSGYQQIQGFNFLVPIDTVKEFIARAGIKTNVESLFNKLWVQALAAFRKQDCDDAMKYCDAVLKLMPGQPDVLKLQRLTQEKMTKGECPLSMKKIILYVAIGVAVLILLLLIIFLLRRGGKKKAPAISPGPEAESLEGVTLVEKPAEIAMSLGVLVGKEGPLEGKTFEISKEGIKIGRDPAKCDIVIDNPHVSREHAWVGEENGKIMAKDLASANGTFLNTLSHQIKSEVLTPGDILIIGKGKMASFVFKKPEG